MQHPSSRVLAGAVSVVLVLAVGACGGDDDDATATTTTAASTTTAAAPATTGAASPATTAVADDGMYATPSPSAATGGTISMTDSSLGPILVDGQGMTLYVFLPDDEGPSACIEDCLAAWPALYAPVTAGEGVDAALIGTAARPDDGKEQATYGGWPLYTFVQDAAPGDVNGQGVNDVWYVVGADGEPVQTAP